MKIGFILLFVTLLLGQLGAITVLPGIVVYVHDVVLFVILCIGFWKTKHFIRPTLFIPIVGFSVVGFISLFFALFRFEVWQVALGSLYLVRWIIYACLYIFIRQSSKFGMFLLRGLFVTGSAFSVLGLMQYILYPSLRNLWYLGWDPHYYRLFSTFLDPNFAGLFIVLTILLGFARMRINKWIWFVQGINFLALYLTYSRGSYLALLVGSIIWVILEKRWKILWLVTIAVSLVILIPKPGGNTLALLRRDSTISRIDNWKDSIQIIQRSPIIGHGFNTLRIIRDDPISKAASGVDNSFLFLSATTGIVGLGMYLWLLWSTVDVWHVYHIAILAALLIHSQFINSLFYPWIMIWFWIYIGARETIFDT